MAARLTIKAVNDELARLGHQTRLEKVNQEMMRTGKVTGKARASRIPDGCAPRCLPSSNRCPSLGHGGPLAHAF